MAARFAAALVVVGLLGGIGIVEGTLWLADLPHEQPRHSETARFDIFGPPLPGTDVMFYLNAAHDPIRFEYADNPRGYFDARNGVDHPVNRAGFRGPPWSKVKPDRTFRAVFLGDSFTFGEGVWHKDTFVARTADLLNIDLAAGATRVQTLNLGVGGYNTFMQEQLLSRALAYDPDLVIVVYVLNDPEPPLYRSDGGAGYERIARPAFVEESHDLLQIPRSGIHTLRTTRLLTLGWRRWRMGARTLAYYRALFDDRNPGWADSQRSLQRIGEHCRARGIPCAVACFPVLMDLAQYPLKAEHAKVGAAARAAGLSFLDLRSEFEGRNERDLWVHPTDQHPNEHAHELAAQRLAAWLRERFVGR